ncbi:M48 metallopeptidase family protein [Butyrivibrio sp. FC2001]|uniref:M48 metallopeptidase family protein n=1 Tax=Butyrivibrio sp. FC2001 TaxID=1280671 RepID=UPI001A98CD00|nr:M48 family metallopeptidase [Butyrivibrio sp. FC2001]
MKEAKDKLPKQVSRYSKSMGIDFDRVFIKAQKTRWGSCSDRGNISLNCLLMVVPPYVRKYVIIHELAHRKVMSHSTEFWKIIAEEMPDYRKAIRWLDKNGDEIIDRLGA